MPISAPKPNSSPSVKRVDAFTTTAAASTSCGEPPRRVEVAGEDRLGVPGAEPVDVVDRGVERRHRRRRSASARGTRVAKSSSVATPMARHAAPGRRRRRRARRPRRRARRRPRGRNSSATASCTTSDSAALHTLGRWVFAFTTMSSGRVEVGRRVDVDVAVAVAVDDHRHGRVVADALDQRRAAPRDQAVDDVGELHDLDRGLVATSSTSTTASSGRPALARPSRSDRRRSRGSSAARCR